MRQPIALLLACTILFSACATAPAKNAGAPANVKEWLALQSRARKKAAVGFVIGALAGYANARITGVHGEDVWKHALGGGIAGAIAGFAIGRRQDTIFAGRDHAIRQAGYDSSQGYIARVEEVAFDPPQPKPGTTAVLYVRYLVLGPDPNESIKVTMFRGLKYGQNYVFGAGPNEFEIPKGGGIVESKVPVTFPAKAPVGTYDVEALVEDPQRRFPQAVGTGALYIVARAQQRGEAITAAP